MSAAKQPHDRSASRAARPLKAPPPSTSAVRAPAARYLEIEARIDKALAETADLMTAFNEARKGKALSQFDGAIQQDDINRLGEALRTLAAARRAIIETHEARPARRQIASTFLTSVQEDDEAYISPKRFSAALGVQLNVLADLAGVHRNTLRNPSSERTQSKLREMAKAISAAEALTGDLTAALYWYRNEPIGEYDHRTPAELVAAGHVEAVLAYLRDLENGAAG